MPEGVLLSPPVFVNAIIIITVHSAIVRAGA